MCLWPMLHPGPRWGSLQCSPDPIADFKGAGGKRRDEEEETKEKGRKVKEAEREGKRIGWERGRGKGCIMSVGGWTPQ